MDTIIVTKDELNASQPIHSLRGLPARSLVAAMGAFDGVHLGHQALIQEVRQIAQHDGLLSGVITFDPHPRRILQPDGDLRLISNLQEKCYLIERTGIDYLIVLPFSQSLASYTAERYLCDILEHHLQLHTLVIGFDHHFGSDRGLTFDDYKAIAARYGIRCLQGVPFALGGQDPTSSTEIRRNIAEGRIVDLQAQLGHRYILLGDVVSGFQVGRKMGYPTANIQLLDPTKALPPDGVYMAYTDVEDGESQVPSMLYIGMRPTFQQSMPERSIEVFLMDGADHYLYGRRLVIHLCDRLRNDMRFDSIKELQRQIAQDELYVRRYFSLI